MGKKYIITGAQYGARVNHDFLDSLNLYANTNNAEILILPIKGRTVEDTLLVKELSDYKIIDKNHKLNEKIRLSRYQILPQMIDPITGLARFTQSDVSTIFASPKLRMKVVPNSNNSLPKVLMTSGAITMPNYRDNRIGKIAEQDHTFGAIIVETDGRSKYHYRQLNSLQNGTFYDLGIKYSTDGIEESVRPEAMVLGDWHFGDTDPKVRRETLKMISTYQPKRIFLHDLFNGTSINHWEQGKIVTLARKKNMLSLEKELKGLRKELDVIIDAAGEDTEIVIVRSNHDEWLDSYIESGRFIKEPANTLLGAKLLPYMIRQYNPLEVALNNISELPDNINFLGIDEDYKVRGFQLGSHGHKGAHGARGSVRSIESAHGKSVTGHSHVPEIFRDVWKVGTSTKLNLDYTQGLSGWMHSHLLLYDNGKSQLVNIINGKHRG